MQALPQSKKPDGAPPMTLVLLPYDVKLRDNISPSRADRRCRR